MWIQNFVDWLAEASNALTFAQLVAAFVTAAATIALWRVTGVLAVETKTLAATSSRPFVVGLFEPSNADSGAFDVTLRNTGNATAFDIRLSFTPTLPGPQEEIQKDTETSFELSVLAPGQSLPLVGVMYRDAPETSFGISVSWSAEPSSKDRKQISYNSRIYSGISRGWNVKGMHQIAEELERLRKVQEKKE